MTTGARPARDVLVAAVQLAAGPFDVDAAIDDAVAGIVSARGADIVALPELATTRYDLRREIHEAAPQPGQAAFDRVASAARDAGCVVVLGFAEHRDGATYNSVAVLDRDGTLAGVRSKAHLFAGETRVFAAAERIRAVDTSVGRLGVAVCFDMELPETMRTLALQGAEVLVVSTANMAPYGPYQDVYTRSRAMENGLPLVLANWVGEGPRFTFVGMSRVVSQTGVVLADAGDLGPATISARIRVGPIGDVDPAVDYLAVRRPELYS
jgi:predicted amidohydrolase